MVEKYLECRYCHALLTDEIMEHLTTTTTMVHVAQVSTIYSAEPWQGLRGGGAQSLLKLPRSLNTRQLRTLGDQTRPVVLREPDSGKYQPLPEVQGKGKEKVVNEQAAHDLLTLQTPTKKSPVDQFIFQRRPPMPTEPTGHADSPSLDTKLALTDSETESDEEVHVINTGDQDEGQARPNLGEQDEGQAGPNPGIQDEGQAGSNPGDAIESQPQPSHVVHVGPNLKHMDVEATDASGGELACSMGTLSSRQTLKKTSASLLVFCSEALKLKTNPGKRNADTKVGQTKGPTYNLEISIFLTRIWPTCEMKAILQQRMFEDKTPTRLMRKEEACQLQELLWVSCSPPPPPLLLAGVPSRFESTSFTAAQKLSPTDSLMQDDSIPDEQVHLSDDEDSGNDHLPKANLETRQIGGTTYLKMERDQRLLNLLGTYSFSNNNTIAEEISSTCIPVTLKDLNLLLLQGHLDHLPGSDKWMLSTDVKLWTQNLVIRQRVKDFQLGIDYRLLQRTE
ncbi:hypothetical protein Tco_0213171 [Tanacetum coccineum]